MVNAKIVIPVEINNKTYHFLLDTGAPNVISKSLFNEIKTTTIDKISINDANNLKDSLEAVTIKELKIGSLAFENSVGMFGSANKEEQFQLNLPKLTINQTIFENVATNTTNDQNSRIGLDLLE
jgi:predicted aspartyl protease